MPNGTNVIQWTNDGSIEQKFRLVYNSRDSYKLHAMCSSKGSNRVVDIYKNGGVRIKYPYLSILPLVFYPNSGL